MLTTGIAVMKTGATLLARIVGNAGQPITQASLSAIRAEVQDVTTNTEISAYALTVSDVVFNALQTDPRWTKDATGYNFRWTVPAAALANGGDKYQVDVRFTPVSGEQFVVSWVFALQKVYV